MFEIFVLAIKGGPVSLVWFVPTKVSGNINLERCRSKLSI